MISGKMMKKPISVLLALVFSFLPVFSFLSFFQPAARAAEDYSGYINKVIGYEKGKYNVSSEEDLITALAKDCGSSATDWTVIALKQSGYEGSCLDYISALESSFYSKASRSTDKERMSLVFAACGGGTDKIKNTLYTVPGSLGIMSYVYGLILADSYDYAISPDRNVCINEILKTELDGGGFALYGGTPDIDVTAMTLTALAPYMNREDVRGAADRALTVLSERQSEEGDYYSFWTAPPERNCESVAQVIIALSSLGIDCREDSRFIKNGIALIDALLDYMLPDGSFSHTPGGRVNDISTAQAFLALVSYNRLLKGGTRVFNFSGNRYNLSEKEVKNGNGQNPPANESQQKPVPSSSGKTGQSSSPKSNSGSGTNNSGGSAKTATGNAGNTVTNKNGKNSVSSGGKSKPAESTAAGKEETEDKPAETPTTEQVSAQDTAGTPESENTETTGTDAQRGPVKPRVINEIPSKVLFIAAAALTFALLGYQNKKVFKNKYAKIILPALAALSIVWLSLIPASAAFSSARVDLSIRIDTVYDESEITERYSSPVILNNTKIAYTEGMTAYDAFKTACDKNAVGYDYSGAGDNLYISSIDSLSEFDFGPLSGWMYSVNGYFPSVSAGAYEIYPGDVILFEYTENLGNDLETK